MPLLLVLVLTAPVAAAPAADLVVIWAPGMRTAPVESAARKAGAAVLDRSPVQAGAGDAAQVVQRGIDAFDKLDLAVAWQALEQARSEVVRSGGAGLSRAQLSDLFLYRGLIKAQQDDTAAAWEELVVANTIDPTRELDPGRFAPKVRGEFERAKQTVLTKSRAKLTLQLPDGCTANVDGAPIAGPVQLVVGPHWINTTCADRQPYGYRIELTTDVTVPVDPARFVPPSDADLLVQARTAGSRAFVSVEVRSGVATARLVGLDGRERDRRTVAVTNDLEGVADALTALLTPPKATHWYKSRGAWAVGGVAAAAAIFIPLTAYLSNDNGNATWGLRGPSPQ